MDLLAAFWAIWHIVSGLLLAALWSFGLLLKGFTRIIFRVMEKYSDLEIQLVLGGFNHKNGVHFPNGVALYYGQAIALTILYKSTDLNTSIVTMKTKITESLKQLTTHISAQVDDDTA